MRRAPIERQVADAAARALRAEPGSVLAFLPGAAEIRRAETLLKERIDDPSVDVVALFGALEADVQDRAIAPSPKGRRKIVLATSIAETSLTIEGVRIVIDCGLSRVPRYEPDVGLTRLETVRVSRASADQRRGRAGRTEPGVCYRLWDEPQTASLAASGTPEILAADLTSLVLDLAHWGVSDPAKLDFLDPPPQAAWSEARSLLVELGAIDGDGRITDEGRALRQLPLPPRIARMVVDAAACGAAQVAADIAAVLTERGLGGNDVDLTHRLDNLRRDRSRRAQDARAMAKRWAQVASSSVKESKEQSLSPGVLLALAYPDRIARSRGAGGSFLLANGRGANVDQASALARETYLAVGEIAGTAAQGRILLAAPLTPAEIEAHFGERIEARDEIAFDAATASLRARRLRRLGAVTLGEQIRKVEPDDDTARMLAEGIARLGLDRLPWSKALRQWRDRVVFLRRATDLGFARDRQSIVPSRPRPTWEATSGPTSPMPRLRQAPATGLPPRSRARPPSRRSAPTRSPMRSTACCRGTSAAGSTPRRRRISPRRRDRRCRSTTRRRRGRSSPSACRSCSASTSIRRLPAGACRW